MSFLTFERHNQTNNTKQRKATQRNVQMPTHIFDFNFQLLLTPLRGTFECHVFKEV